jgi:hypothetical protein
MQSDLRKQTAQFEGGMYLAAPDSRRGNPDNAREKSDVISSVIDEQSVTVGVVGIKEAAELE